MIHETGEPAWDAMNAAMDKQNGDFDNARNWDALNAEMDKTNVANAADAKIANDAWATKDAGGTPTGPDGKPLVMKEAKNGETMIFGF